MIGAIQEWIKNPVLFKPMDYVYYVGNEQDWAYNMRFQITGEIYYQQQYKLYFASYLVSDDKKYYLSNVPIHDLSHYKDTILYPTYNTKTYRVPYNNFYYYITDMIPNNYTSKVVF